MEKNIQIALAVCSRPEYTARVLAGIIGMKGFTDLERINVSIDRLPDGTYHQGVEGVLSYFGLDPVRSASKLGCNGNIKQALDKAWSVKGTEFVIMIEDDCPPAIDMWTYMIWAAKKFKDEPKYRTVAAWNHGAKGWKPNQPWNEGEEWKVMAQEWFSCWIWGTWKDRWEEISEKWTTGSDHHSTSWDVKMYNDLNGRLEIAPSISRALNIGENGGTHRGRSFPIVMSSGFVDVDIEGPLPYWFSEE